MKTLKLNILTLLSVFVLFACYEDKGNYDYIAINEVTIDGIEDEYEIVRWDTLRIQVALENSIKEPTSLAYAWYIDGKKVADTKDLDYVISEKSKKYQARFEVTDPNSDDVRFFKDFILMVHAQYAKGLMMLSKVDGVPELSFKGSVEGSESKIINGIFERENNEKMEGVPLNLEQPDQWAYGGVLFVHTSKHTYQLDPTYFKEIMRFDENTLTEKEPEYNMKFCTFEGVPDFGAAVGTNGRIYSKVSRQDRFSSPSLYPVYNADSLEERVNYFLAPLAMVSRNGALTYDELSGRFMFFETSYEVETYDSEQYTAANIQKTVIGLSWIGYGSRMRGGSYNIASLFYDKASGKAALAPGHNYIGKMVGKDSLVILENHRLHADTRMLINTSDDYLYYSDGSNGIFMINLADPDGKYNSIRYECELPEDCKITLLKMASDNLSLYVGVLTDRNDKYNGDLYRLNIADGSILEHYEGFGGEPVSLIEKYYVEEYE